MHAIPLIVAAATAATAAPRGAPMRARFLYPLTDGVGRLSFGWTSFAWDGEASELYVLDNPNGMVDVFDDNGMMVHSFGDPSFGRIAGVALIEGGDLLVLAVKDAGTAIVRCNFRGEPRATIAIRGAPKELARFTPASVYVVDGAMYLGEQGNRRVMVAGLDGQFRAAYDLLQLAGVSGKERRNAVVRGLSVDGDGDLLFTIATSFHAYVISPDGQVRSFGDAGSLPGQFNIAGGIAADDEGHLFISDTLRSVVMAFDKQSFEFLGEFGYRGSEPGSLINPLEIAVGHGRVYVSQSVGSVKAFGVAFE